MLIFGCFVLARQHIMPFYLSNDSQTMDFVLRYRSAQIPSLEFYPFVGHHCFAVYHQEIRIVFIRKIDICILKMKGIRFACCMTLFWILMLVHQNIQQHIVCRKSKEIIRKIKIFQICLCHIAIMIL